MYAFLTFCNPSACLAGMCDLGGVKYFNVTIDGGNGELEALDFVLEGMNAPVDESAEERKGGAGHLGKLLYSAAEGGSAVALACNIPKALQEERPEVSMGAWVLAVLKAAAGTKIGKIEYSAEVVKVRCRSVSTIQSSSPAARFLREPILLAGLLHL